MAKRKNTEQSNDTNAAPARTDSTTKLPLPELSPSEAAPLVPELARALGDAIRAGRAEIAKKADEARAADEATSALPEPAPSIEPVQPKAEPIQMNAPQPPRVEPVQTSAPQAPCIEVSPHDRAPEPEQPTAEIRNFPIASEADSARWRRRRMAMLAASIAVAAVIGGGVGAFATAAFNKPAPPKDMVAHETRALKQTVTKLGQDLAALRTGVDSAGRSTATQLSRMAERIERAERAQAEPNAKLARIAEALDRLERRHTTAAALPVPVGAPAPLPPAHHVATPPQPPVQGAMLPVGPQPPANIPPQSQTADVTGSVSSYEKNQSRLPIVEGWRLIDVYAGRAVLENRMNGNLYDVGQGSVLPGIGRIEQIRREDNQVTVVTPKGIITAALSNTTRRGYGPYR